MKIITTLLCLICVASPALCETARQSIGPPKENPPQHSFKIPNLQGEWSDGGLGNVYQIYQEGRSLLVMDGNVIAGFGWIFDRQVVFKYHQDFMVLEYIQGDLVGHYGYLQYDGFQYRVENETQMTLRAKGAE